MARRFVTPQNRETKSAQIRDLWINGVSERDIARLTNVSRFFIGTVKREQSLDARRSPAFSESHPGQRRCSKCKEWLPSNAFNSDPRRAGGLHPTCRSCRRAAHAAGRPSRGVVILLKSTRATAKRRNLEHTLTADDITIPDHCPVLGIKLYFDPSGRTDHSPSVDRIDHKKGYTPGNIIVVSFRANVLRGNATAEELRRLAEFYLQFALR